MAPFAGRTLDSARVAELIGKDILEEKEESLVLEEHHDDPRMGVLGKIKLIALAVACVSGLVSVWYTFDWYRRSQPLVLSAVLALVIGACDMLMPELAIFLFRRKRLVPALGGLVCAILAFIAISFSTGTTIGGLYDSRSANLVSADSGRAAVVSSAIERSGLESSLRRLDADRTRLEKDEALYSRKVEEIMAAFGREGAGAREIPSLEKRRDAARKEMARVDADAAKARARLVELSREAVSTAVVRDDFYSFLGGRIGLSPEAVEFIMVIFPAVFNEIVAPSMLTIVLFL